MKKRSRVFAALAGAAALSIGAAGIASAATMGDPAGPLTEIVITPDLNCSVEFLGDAYPEFYDGTACGTFAAAAGTLYGPSNIPAGSSASPRTAWTQVSQVQGGSGTSADPQSITTTVTGGDLSVTQVDTYVFGQNSYRSSVSVTNTSAAALETNVYRAADCYLQDSDSGFGEYNPSTGSITCRAPDSEGEHSSSGRIEEFVPLTAGSNYLYARYSEVWSAVGSQQPFPNEVRNGSTLIDNGMGLSWTLSLAPGQTKTVGVLTNFSPLGEVGLPTTLSLAESTITVGQETTATASVSNPNVMDQSLSSVTVSLPANVDYVAGSSTALGEPTVSADGRTLTYTGSFAAVSGGQLDFTFKVRGAVVGSGSLGLDGSAAGGAPVYSSSASVTVEEGEPPAPVDPVEIVLGTPVVTQASCTALGAEVPPHIDLPASTSYVEYSLVGDVVAGGTVIVEATPKSPGVLPTSADGWVIDEERNVASMEITLDEVECVVADITVAPEDPKITQATCEAGPKVTLKATQGVTYSGVPTTLKGGDKFTVTATPSEGYVLVEESGWTLNEDGTASKEFTLDKTPKCSTNGGGLAKTGVNPLLVGLGLGGLALAAAGGGLLIVRRNRNA